ncbi:hemin uptake protein HemP [Yokenella regensburgei]|uniref:hemin uptake protein HemP n=1 Tax=Yokenella regensburgei TaxID=158877 RepID=UPI003F5CF321
MVNREKNAAQAEQPSVGTNPASILPEDRRITSQALLGEEARIVIIHQGQEYLLRQTQAGKLILTK